MKRRNPKILLVGHGRHGKDTVAELIQLYYGFSFQSSSEFAAEEVVYPVLKDKYGYKNPRECFEDRHKHRAEWYNLISEYCKEDPTRLGRNIFKSSDIYCGLRNKREFHALRNGGYFDVSIWVDRSDKLSRESKKSNSIEPWMADFVIDNNGTKDDLAVAVKLLMDNLLSLNVEVTDMTQDYSKASDQIINLDNI